MLPSTDGVPCGSHRRARFAAVRNQTLNWLETLVHKHYVLRTRLIVCFAACLLAMRILAVSSPSPVTLL